MIQDRARDTVIPAVTPLRRLCRLKGELPTFPLADLSASPSTPPASSAALTGNPTTNVASSVRTQPQSPPAQSSAGNTTQPTANAPPPTVTPTTARKRWCSSDRLNLAATFIGIGAGVYYSYVQYVLTNKNDIGGTWRDCHDRAVNTHTIVFNWEFNNLVHTKLGTISKRSGPLQQTPLWFRDLITTLRYSCEQILES